MNKTILIVAIAVASADNSVLANAKLASTAQKGSLLIFPHVEAKRINPNDTNANNGFSDTYISITNDSLEPVDVQCYWSTTEQFDPKHPVGAGGNIANKWARDAIRKNHAMDFGFTLASHLTTAFWAGNLSFKGKSSLYGLTGGWGNLSKNLNAPAFNSIANSPKADIKGELKCWAVSYNSLKEIHHNHLVGKATIVSFAPYGTAAAPTAAGQAHEYNAWALQAYYQGSSDIKYTGKILPTPGSLDLDGKEYDQCPSALAGQFTPTYRSFGKMKNHVHISLSNCHQDLKYPKNTTAHITELNYIVWDANGTKHSNADECMGAWYESDLGKAFPDFIYKELQTDQASFRVQTSKNKQCADSKGNTSDIETSGIVGVQVNDIGGLFQTNSNLVGLGASTPATSGKGQIRWIPSAQ